MEMRIARKCQEIEHYFTNTLLTELFKVRSDKGDLMKDLHEQYALPVPYIAQPNHRRLEDLFEQRQ